MTDNEIINGCGEVCSDNRFELIEKYKKRLTEATNIETSKDEMTVIDNVLFRCWQMGWLDKLEEHSRQQAEIGSLRKENFELKDGYFQKRYEEAEHAELLALRKAWRKSTMDYIDLNAEWEGKYKTAKAEIERLTALNGVNETCSARKQETIERLEVELKAMRGAANGYKAEAEKLHPYKLHYGNLKAEIVREVCDRVKDIIPAIDDPYIESMVEEHINDLLKEMEKECEENQT